jgi:hypothetical protein
VHPKFDTGAAENLWRAALWPPLLYSIINFTHTFSLSISLLLPISLSLLHYVPHLFSVSILFKATIGSLSYPSISSDLSVPLPMFSALSNTSFILSFYLSVFKWNFLFSCLCIFSTNWFFPAIFKNCFIFRTKNFLDVGSW